MSPNRVIKLSVPVIGSEEKNAVLRVLESGMLAQGPEVAAFEAEFAQRTGANHAVATSSGTSALHLALLAHGIGPGDEVITSAFTFVASANSILFVHAKPVFADIDPATFNIDPDSVGRLVGPKTKAIMPVHLYGQPCDMDALREIAREHGLVIIEDAAQAIGATWRGNSVGSSGTACFSLYATKNIMSGEGGMVTTDDDGVAQHIRRLRNHGMRGRYDYQELGFNLRMTDINAAIGRAQLARLDELNAKRRFNASYLGESITSVTVPTEARDTTHAWHQFTVRVNGGRNRDEAAEKLKAAGIDTGVFYPKGMHELPHIVEACGVQAPLPGVEQAAREVLSLPIHPGLVEADLDYIAQHVNRL